MSGREAKFGINEIAVGKHVSNSRANNTIWALSRIKKKRREHTIMQPCCILGNLHDSMSCDSGMVQHGWWTCTDTYVVAGVRARPKEQPFGDPRPARSIRDATLWGIEKNNGGNPNRQNPPAQNNPETTKDTRPRAGGRGGNVRRKRE